MALPVRIRATWPRSTTTRALSCTRSLVVHRHDATAEHERRTRVLVDLAGPEETRGWRARPEAAPGGRHGCALDLDRDHPGFRGRRSPVGVQRDERAGADRRTGQRGRDREGTAIGHRATERGRDDDEVVLEQGVDAGDGERCADVGRGDVVRHVREHATPRGREQRRLDAVTNARHLAAALEERVEIEERAGGGLASLSGPLGHQAVSFTGCPGSASSILSVGWP